MVGFFIALISGALMSIQGVFNTQVTRSSSIWGANVFVQLTALLVCLGAWLFADRTSFGTLLKVEPKYMLLGGAIGAFITYTVIKSMEMLGCKSCDADRDRTADRSLCHRAFRAFRSGKAAPFHAQGDRHADRHRRNCDL